MIRHGLGHMVWSEASLRSLETRIWNKILNFRSESNVYNSNLLWQHDIVTLCVIMRYSAMAFGTDNTKSTAQLYHSNIQVFEEKKRILCMMSDAEGSMNDSWVIMDL